MKDKQHLHDQIDLVMVNHPPKTAECGLKMDDISEALQEVGHLIVGLCPESRELSLALTHLQQTRMFAIASLALYQKET